MLGATIKICSQYRGGIFALLVKIYLLCHKLSVQKLKKTMQNLRGNLAA